MLRRAVAIACFLLSGVAALVYEICWIRIASLVFGSTLAAVSTVLAVFFAGLALGSALAGLVAQRTTRPLRLYAVLEIALAALALATPWGFEVVDALYGRLYRTAGAHAALLAGARIALVALVLLGPAVLMGATLPLFCRQFVVRRARIAGSVGFLYGVNTLGAAGGAALTGLVLIPTIGVRASIATGATLSAVAGIVTGLLRMPAASAPPAPTARAAPAVGGQRAVVAALFFATGFVALGIEVLWTRFLSLATTNTVHTYTVALTAVLTGIVIGSLLGALLFDRARSRATWFGALQVLVGLSVLTLAALPPALWWRLGAAPAVCFVLLLPAAALSGASFPLAVRLVLHEPGLAGIGVGLMSAVNMVGGIAGSLVVGLLALPALGLAPCTRLLTAVAVGAGITAWIALGPRGAGARRRRAIAALLAVAAWIAIPIASPVRVPADFLASSDRLVDYREGRISNLAVVRSGDVLQLEIDRWWQGEDRRNHQTMAAHVPMLLHPAPRRVLVVGVGTGQSASRYLLHDVEHLDCVDIEPALFEFAPRHFDWSWADDPRVTLIPEDGRHHIAHTDERWDVIALALGQPFRPGVGSFYTSEFYRDAARRLEPGGFLVQLVPLPFLPADEFRRVVRTFIDVFPASMLWYNTSELLLIGTTTDRIAVDRARLEERLARPAIAEDLRYSYWGGPEQWLESADVLLAGYLCGPDELATLAGTARPYRDDVPVLEYVTANASAGQRTELPSVELIRRRPGSVADILEAPPDAERAARIARLRDENVMDMMAHANLRVVEVADPPLDPARAVALLSEALAWNPRNVACNRRLGETLLAAGSADAALRFFDAALAVRPDDPLAHRGRGLIMLGAGRFAEAMAHLAVTLEHRPDDASAHNGMGIALVRSGDAAGAVRHFREAVRLDGGDARLRDNLSRALRDLDRQRGRAGTGEDKAGAP